MATKDKPHHNICRSVERFHTFECGKIYLQKNSLYCSFVFTVQKSIESKIRFNIVLIYILVAAIICGMFFYFYTYGYNVDNQKKDIEEQHKDLARTEELIRSINHAQTEANLYVTTQQSRHLRLFRKQMGQIEQAIDSMRLDISSTPQDSILSEITLLLKEKDRAITALNKQFSNKTPIDTIPPQVETPEPITITEFPTETTIIQDTIVNTSDKKSFWKRLSNVFSPEQKEDTVLVVTKLQTNTVITPPDTMPVKEVMEQARQEFTERITAIERQVSQLIIADQEISSRISDLLIKLYSQIVQSRVEEIQKEEAILQKNNKQVFIIGVIALLVILLFIILIIHDVNKGSAARKALEKANIRTKQLMDSRHQLLLSVSHDAKTPLNSILGYLELWQNRKELSEKEIASIQNSGKYILALLENLLEFSSLEQGTLQVSPKDFYLQKLCQETTDMFAPLAHNKKLSFKCKFDFKSDLCLYSDPLKIRQILINILSNAVKYTSEGEITFEVRYADDNLYCCIEDTGVGIPADQIDNLFKPFSRITENNSIAEGNGFGMYVVKGLVDLLQGHINLQSERNIGTRVRVFIPIKEGECKPSDLSTKKLLIIDDDYAFLSMINEICLNLGHTVTTCNTLSDFQKVLPYIGEYNMVFTDMEMNTFTGKDILAEIRNSHPQIPVIIMTARGDYNEEIAKAAGFDGYLSKPITVESIRSLAGGRNSASTGDNVLEQMFGQDTDAIMNILETFIQVSIENIVLLRESIKENDFHKAQALCHKMLPMFMQVNAPAETITLLKEMDAMRSKEATDYPEWKEKINCLLEETEELLIKIQDQYFTD